MKKQNLFLLTAALLLSYSSWSQVIETELIGDDKKKIVALSNSKMYEGSESKKAEEYFNQAYDLARDGKLLEAEKLYLLAIKEDPNFVEAYDNIGRLYRRMDDYDKAKKYYKKSIELYPEGMMAHQNLAVVYGLEGDFDKAVNEYKTMIRFEPENAEGYFGLASSYLNMDKIDEALEPAKTAVRLYEEQKSPHLADGYHVLGIILLNEEDIEGAKKYLKLAMDNGADIGTELEKALFDNSIMEPSSPSSDDKFTESEPKVLLAYNWLLNTPLGEDDDKRQELNTYLIKWMADCPYITIELGQNADPFVDCADCLGIFLGGWTAHAIQTGEYDNVYTGSLAGTEDAIDFYKRNKKALGKNKDIEKLIALQDQGKLASYVKSKIPNRNAINQSAPVD